MSQATLDDGRHMDKVDRHAEASWARVPLLLLLAIAAFFLFAEHRAHLLGALPFVLVLLCPLLHLLHGRHHGRIPDQRQPGSHGGDGQEVSR